MTQPDRTHLVTLLALIAVAAPAWGADRSCLTGNDPAVAADAGQIAALDARIAATCPCAAFDGSKGKTRRDYMRCVSPLLSAAVKGGALRAQCKPRIAEAHRQSICGAASSSGLAPCIETTSGGRVGCRIKAAPECRSDRRSSRVACTGSTRCVDAGDTNGDLQVTTGDSGACIVPPTATATATATSSSTATATPPATATATPSSTATATPSSTATATPSFTATATPPSTATATPTTQAPTETTTPTDSPRPTEPPDFGWTFCADLEQPCVLPGNRQVRFGHGGVYVSKFIAATAVSCSYAVFDPNLEGEYESDPHCDYFIDGPTRTPTNTGTATATATPTSTATSEAGWVFCAGEHGSCTMPSAYRLARFGIPGHYVVKVADSTVVECTVAAFGADPAVGHVKRCEYSSSDEVLPTFTPTSTATPTSTPTTTPTVPTSTPTATSTPRLDWVLCANPGETCVLPGHGHVVSWGIPSEGSDYSTYLTTVAENEIECSFAALFPGVDAPPVADRACYYLSDPCNYDVHPSGFLVTNRFSGDLIGNNLEMLPHPPKDAIACINFDPQKCRLTNPLSGDFPNDIAVVAVDPRVCTPQDYGHLSYHWTIRYSPSANNGEAVYAPRAITGYFEPVLNIPMQSLPSFELLADKYWRLHLTITREPHSDYPMSVDPVISNYVFLFLYTEAAINLTTAQACQAHSEPHPSCEFDDMLRAPEGTY